MTFLGKKDFSREKFAKTLRILISLLFNQNMYVGIWIDKSQNFWRIFIVILVGLKTKNDKKKDFIQNRLKKHCILRRKFTFFNIYFFPKSPIFFLNHGIHFPVPLAKYSCHWLIIIVIFFLKMPFEMIWLSITLNCHGMSSFSRKCHDFTRNELLPSLSSNKAGCLTELIVVVLQVYEPDWCRLNNWQVNAKRLRSVCICKQISVISSLWF